MEKHRKIPISLINPIFLKVNSASCYPLKYSNNTIFYAGENNGDKNNIKVKFIKEERYGFELEIALLGEYHLEKKTYANTSNWVSWFRFDLSGDIETLTKFRNFIDKAIEFQKNEKITKSLKDYIGVGKNGEF